MCRPAHEPPCDTPAMTETKPDMLAAVDMIDEAVAASPRTVRVFALVVVFVGFLYMALVLAAILVAGWAIAEWLTRQHETEFLLLLVPTVLLLFVSVAEACWVKIPRDEETELSRDDAPALFAMIEDLGGQLDTRVHRVVVDTKFNASATSERRWIFGRRLNVIGVGYSLLCALDADDWRIVLAHEVAHLKSAHAQQRNIFYRAVTAWTGLDERLREGKHWASIFFAWFFRRSSQLVQVLAMALDRQQEREADVLTAQVVGERARSEALLRLSVRRALTDDYFWAPINARAKREPEPPSDIYSRELPAFLGRAHERDARAALQKELKRRTEWHSTHPSTYERHIKALNVTPAEEEAFVAAWVLPPIGESGATTFLSDAARNRIVAEFDVEWQQARMKTWQASYQRAVARRRELDALESAIASRELSEDERIAHARLTAQLEDDATAEPVLRAALAKYPDRGVAYLLAGICLQRDDAEGVALMESAIAKGPTLATNGYRVLIEYARRQGDRQSILAYERELHFAQARDRERDADRASLTTASRFVAHDLPWRWIEAAIRALPNEPLVRKAWLARVVVRHGGEPVFVLLLDTGWWRPGVRRRDRVLLKRLAPECRFATKGFVTTQHTWRRLRRRIRRAAGAPVYVRRVNS